MTRNHPIARNRASLAEAGATLSPCNKGGGTATSPPEVQAYAELHCISNFTFLRGASFPEELVERAAALGYSAIAITD